MDQTTLLDLIKRLHKGSQDYSDVQDVLPDSVGYLNKHFSLMDPAAWDWARATNVQRMEQGKRTDPNFIEASTIPLTPNDAYSQTDQNHGNVGLDRLHKFLRLQDLLKNYGK